MMDAKSCLSEASSRERAGDPLAAYALFRAVLDSSPVNLPALDGVVRTARRIGRPSEAVRHLRAAVAADPRMKAARVTLVKVLIEARDLTEAREQAEALVAMAARDADAINLLGVVLKQQGRHEEAIQRFRDAIRLDRRHSSALANLGNTLLDRERHEEAIATFTQLTKLTPKDAEAVRRLGRAQHMAMRLQEALPTLNRAVMMNARSPLALQSRGTLLNDLGRLDEAMADVERGLALAPDDVNLQHLRCVVLRRSGRPQEALRQAMAILCADPAQFDSWRLLGNLFAMDLGDNGRANLAYRRALTIEPRSRAVTARLCYSLMNSRHGDEGANIDQAYFLARPLVESGDVALEMAGDLQPVFLRTADYDGLARLGEPARLMEHWVSTGSVSQLHLQIGRVRTMEERRQLLALHRRWGDGVQKRIPARSPPRAGRTARQGGGKLRIGLMSSDLRQHPVGNFVLPLVEQYHRDSCELYCYSFYPKAADPLQARIASLTDGYRLMAGASDAEAAERIAEDKLDVLFELGGSTMFNRLSLMAHKPAPVQVSWLGYPHSAGLSRIDRMLMDPYLVPPDPSLLFERPLVMPESWVCVGEQTFRPVPIETRLPEERTGVFTFGTMNNPYKYTPDLFALWARVLLAVPGSRFLFVRPEGGSSAFRRNTVELFVRHGVGAERIAFTAVRGQHLPHYNAIDVALDTAPQTGGTTTCEALWMGVPTVTLVGPAFFERLSHSNLANAGLAGLCAATPDEYVVRAAALVEDRPLRQALRQGVRDLIKAHPLGQTARWVENFQTMARLAAEESTT